MDLSATSIYIRMDGLEQAPTYAGPMSQALSDAYSSASVDPEQRSEPPKPIRSLASRPPVVQAGKLDSASAERIFHDSDDISHLVILDNLQRPVGLLTRSRLYIKTGGAYGYALFANKLVDSLASPEFIVASAESPVSKVAAAAMSRGIDTLYDPIIVVESNGRFAGSVTVKDLLESAESSLVKAKQKAETAARLKSEFLSAMSHEIRTPLNAIVNMARAISGSGLSPFQSECAETLSESSMHLLGVVNNILDFSRLESGKLSMECVDFDLRKLLSFCVKAVAIQLQGKPVEVLFEEAPGLPDCVKGDPLRLRQVVLNLLGNAAKFTFSGSIVLKAQLITECEDGALKLLFIVSDTGIGIPKRMLPGIFRRFSQADVSTCRMYGGSGLGLAICRQLVELMGGSIWAESQEGKGSCFSFTASFGLGVASRQVALEPVDNQGKPADSGRFERIEALLVEDNPFNVKVAKLLFSEMGHSLVCAASGREGLEILRCNSFDLVLTDIEMPEMDGFEFARRLRAGEAGEAKASLPVIAMSAHVGESWRDKCLASGMDAYLSKPVDPSELASILRRFKRKASLRAAAPLPQAPQKLSDTKEFFDVKSTRLRSGGNERIVMEMRRIFVEETPSLIRAARKALSARDFPALRICAHSLKGNAASVDSKSCAEVAKALEDSSKDCDEAKCSSLLPLLESSFAPAIAALKAKQNENAEMKASEK